MTSMFDKEMRHAVEFIPDRLYYVALSSPPPTAHASRHFFSVDKEMVYWNFYLDFGPLNLGHLYRFCMLLNNKLNDSRLKDKAIFFYSHTHAHKRTNAAYLICSWSLLYQNKSPEEAFRPFRSYPAPFPPWHDATPSVCTFNLTILDTLKGLAKAREHKFFDFARFNIEEYEHYEQVENGDLNWYVEGRFLGFAGPHAERECSPGGYYTLRPEDYIPYFKRKGVTLVVRLNKSYYDPKKFTSQGIEHMDMYFLDGSNPPEHILQKFIAKCEETTGGIAVHCKAGLGRTGTCIACYIMKHYKWTAEEIIGWMRIARPGSVIGPQQHFLKDIQMRMWREGDAFRAKGGASMLPTLSPSPGPPPSTPPLLTAKSDDSNTYHTPRGSGGMGMSSDSRDTGRDSTKRPASGGIAANDHSTNVSASHSNTPTLPSTPTSSLQTRLNRMSLNGGSGGAGSNASPPSRGSASGSGSGKLPSSTRPPPPTSPSFFDTRPSSSSARMNPSSPPTPSTALSSYFRASPSPSTSTSHRPSTSTRTNTTPSATAQAGEYKAEEEGRSQGDLLRQRRAQHGASGSAATAGTSTTSSPTGGTTAGYGDSSPPSGSKTRSGRTFNFLSSWSK